MEHIFKCTKCGNYTMEQICPKCKSPAVNPKPAKYSPDDKYGSYRRQAKKEQLKQEGLL
jgi:H/ACA ribonucleoprotein complex subunit 3